MLKIELEKRKKMQMAKLLEIAEKQKKEKPKYSGKIDFENIGKKTDKNVDLGEKYKTMKKPN